MQLNQNDAETKFKNAVLTLILNFGLTFSLFVRKMNQSTKFLESDGFYKIRLWSAFYQSKSTLVPSKHLNDFTQ